LPRQTSGASTGNQLSARWSFLLGFGSSFLADQVQQNYIDKGVTSFWLDASEGIGAKKTPSFRTAVLMSNGRLSRQAQDLAQTERRLRQNAFVQTKNVFSVSRSDG
jgi:alpha-glucosidase (family GH31 glycosyl hydrolase)